MIIANTLASTKNFHELYLTRHYHRHLTYKLYKSKFKLRWQTKLCILKCDCTIMIKSHPSDWSFKLNIFSSTLLEPIIASAIIYWDIRTGGNDKNLISVCWYCLVNISFCENTTLSIYSRWIICDKFIPDFYDFNLKINHISLPLSQFRNYICPLNILVLKCIYCSFINSIDG